VIFRSRGAVIPKTMLILVFAIGAFAAIATLAFLPLDLVRSAESPDGAFIAVATRPFFFALVPMMPGQSGDAPRSDHDLPQGRPIMRFGAGRCGLDGSGFAL